MLLKCKNVNWECFFFFLRIHWRLSTILKRSNKIVWSNAFWYVKVYIFWKFIEYTIHWDKTQMLTKFRSDQRKLFLLYSKLFFFFLSSLTRVSLFFLLSFACAFLLSFTHHSFTFSSQLFYDMKHMVRLSKTVSGIFHFRFRLVFTKLYIFVQQKA